jgi:hypothetical protein
LPCGPSTKAMSRRNCWLHNTHMASLRPEVATERCIRCSLDSTNTLLFFVFTGTRIPYHASAAVSRKAERLDTSKRWGRLARACVMENVVSAASLWQRLDIEGLLYPVLFGINGRGSALAIAS